METPQTAAGKAGAILAAFAFNVLINVGGTNAFLPQTLGIFAAIQFLGIFTTMLILESKGKGVHLLKKYQDKFRKAAANFTCTIGISAIGRSTIGISNAIRKSTEENFIVYILHVAYGNNDQYDQTLQ
ncbi:unnamed protein product [Didymodactylos carnosus]|uniref:Uncharacterized protein n=1 Tax=Didymodactylos carnosus TaxID=1234261 RepID=A0A814JLH4_9BILA|nr:unnamed protein product [Didymodactylos carnosus]CAF3809125.1 unnamed protein product [Didymodactylos carnosus]